MLAVDRAKGASVLMAVDDYVLGHCFRKRLRERVARGLATATDDGDSTDGAGLPPLDPEVEAALAAGQLPLIKLGLEQPGVQPILGIPPEADFEAGLEWLLDGIEAMAEAQRAGNGDL
jgi:hypothetical protein